MDGNSMLIGGQWQSAIGTGKTEDVTSPYDGSVVGTVPVSGVRDVDAAMHGGRAWRRGVAAYPGARAVPDPDAGCGPG